MEPKKWWQVYNPNSPEGSDERNFFSALARNPKYDWQSVSGIATKAKLTEKRVEEIIKKYHKLGIVLQSPKNEQLWGYWEDHKSLVAKKTPSISDKDTKIRTDKVLAADPANPPPVKKKVAPKKAATTGP